MATGNEEWTNQVKVTLGAKAHEEANPMMKRGLVLFSQELRDALWDVLDSYSVEIFVITTVPGAGEYDLDISRSDGKKISKDALQTLTSLVTSTYERILKDGEWRQEYAAYWGEAI